MKKQELSKRQQQIYDFIKSYLQENEVPPSIREICSGVGLSSPSTVHVHLKVLEDKGYISRKSSKSRLIKLNENRESGLADNGKDFTKKIGVEQQTLTHVPLVGNVAAGSPILAQENIEEEYMLPVSLVSDASTFMLNVRGDSMINVGIYNGDKVIVKSQNTAQNGDIVVAMIDGEATVKTIYFESDAIRLQPQNDNMEPIYSRNVQIVGLVIGLFRAYN